jgi:O-acetyl-ADP-ribose deacetylase (regulator of RNase III)
MKMSKIFYIKGDATRPSLKPAIVCHVVNNLGAWGAGFVMALSNRFGEGPKKQYQKWIKKENGDVLGKVLFVDAVDISIANLGAQEGIGLTGGVPIRYNALDNCLEILYKKAAMEKATVHMPRIGCGLAGGKWELVEPLILKHMTVDTYVYDLK